MLKQLKKTVMCWEPGREWTLTGSLSAVPKDTCSPRRAHRDNCGCVVRLTPGPTLSAWGSAVAKGALISFGWGWIPLSQEAK